MTKEPITSERVAKHIRAQYEFEEPYWGTFNIFNKNDVETHKLTLLRREWVLYKYKPGTLELIRVSSCSYDDPMCFINIGHALAAHTEALD